VIAELLVVICAWAVLLILPQRAPPRNGVRARIVDGPVPPLPVSIYVTPIHPLNDVKKSDLVRLHYPKITYI